MPINIRKNPIPVPRGRERLKWYGPGLIWMLSSVGSGSVLFTPRVASQYGYEMLWILAIVIYFQWVMIREVGRYTVSTGRTLLDGLGDVPGPKGWAIWAMFLPQIFNSIVSIAGISALAASAMVIALPGSHVFYAPALIVVSIILVVTGHYKRIEKITSLLAMILSLSAIISAVIAFPELREMGSGLVPGLPEDFDPYFVLPWVGFILAGSAGIIWFSYWVSARGFGGDVTGGEPDNKSGESGEEEAMERIKGWIGVMGQTAFVGVATGSLVILSFMILGAEILRPEGIVPEGIRVAEDLTNLFSEIWGEAGRWLILLGIMIALGGTILTNQDAWGRLFADATLLLKPRSRKGIWGSKWLDDRHRLRNIHALIFTAMIPLAILALTREPVEILSIGGTIAAVHTPVVVILTLYLNSKSLPKELQAGKFVFASAIFAALFFSAFALFHFADIMGIKIPGLPQPSP